MLGCVFAYHSVTKRPVMALLDTLTVFDIVKCFNVMLAVSLSSGLAAARFCEGEHVPSGATTSKRGGR